MEKPTIQSLIADLEIAKENTRELLENANCSIDMKGLEYWAGRVERLRELIKNSL
jgi:hypothetical protein